MNFEYLYQKYVNDEIEEFIRKHSAPISVTDE